MFNVFIGTKIKIIDNSGASLAECIEIYRSSKYFGANVGGLLLVTIKKVAPNKKIKKGNLCKAIVVRSKENITRSGGQQIILSDNAIVLLHNSTLLPRSKRCKTPLLEELRFSFINGLKVLSLAPVVL
jgi:large subunit ribosomal protein L14